MRTVSSCLLILVAAAIAAAQTCTAPASDVFSTSGASGCTTISTCQTALCACIGGSGSFSTCLNSNSKTCTQVATCYASYFTCLLGTTSVRANSTDACSTYGNTLYIGQLAVAAASSINTTSMYQSCVYNVCLLQNVTGSASSSSLASSVCTSAVLLSGTSTPAPTNAVGNTTEILVTLRISGDWTAILADATKKASVTAALLVDLAKLLGIESRFIKIQSLTSGSLVVQFGVFSGSGVSVATLASAVNAAQGSSSWLGSTSTAYTAAGGTGSLTTLSVSATTAAPGQTLAPGATSPPASPSSAMGAAGMWAAAAVAAVAALMA